MQSKVLEIVLILATGVWNGLRAGGDICCAPSQYKSDVLLTLISDGETAQSMERIAYDADAKLNMQTYYGDTVHVLSNQTGTYENCVFDDDEGFTKNCITSSYTRGGLGPRGCVHFTKVESHAGSTDILDVCVQLPQCLPVQVVHTIQDSAGNEVEKAIFDHMNLQVSPKWQESDFRCK